MTKYLRHKSKNLMIIILLASYLKCEKNQTGNTNDQPDFAEVDLRLETLDIDRNGSISFVAKQTLDGEAVGFEIRLSPNWQIKRLGNSDGHAYFGTGKFIHIPGETDNFINSLAKRYQVRRRTTKNHVIPIQMAGLVDDPRQMHKRPTKMKFFFNSDTERLYSEVFINVDVNRKVVEFHEKDQEYRQKLVDSIAGWN